MGHARMGDRVTTLDANEELYVLRSANGNRTLTITFRVRREIGQGRYRQPKVVYEEQVLVLDFSADQAKHLAHELATEGFLPYRRQDETEDE